MPKVVFTPNLQRHISSPPTEVSATTVRGVLEAVFEKNPKLQSYLLDDQDRLREHVVIFVDGQQIEDRVDLSDGVHENAEIFVMQALSGGSAK